jgi:hypothetical protein
MAPRQPLLPSFLYAASSGVNGSREAPPVVAGAPSEPLGKIEMFSPAYYAAGALGGAAACGFTHAAVTPLDVIKCNIQVRAVPEFTGTIAFFARPTTAKFRDPGFDHTSVLTNAT